MFIFQKLKQISLKIATFWGLGEWKIGGILASLFAFPLLLFGKIIYNFRPILFYWSVLSFFSFSLLITCIISNEDTDSVVLDKLIGMIIAFAFIPLKLKLVLLGFVLFHVINFLRPILFCKTLAYRVEHLPFGLGVLLGDIVSALICNVFLQIVILVA